MATGKSEPKPNPLKVVDDHIGEHLRECEASGELRSAPSYGKPLRFNDGYDDTPAELRMAMKILHDAGVVPPEVELLHRLAALRRDAAAAEDPDAARRIRQAASDLQQLIALRLERLRSGSV